MQTTQIVLSVTRTVRGFEPTSLDRLIFVEGARHFRSTGITRMKTEHSGWLFPKTDVTFSGSPESVKSAFDILERVLNQIIADNT